MVGRSGCCRFEWRAGLGVAPGHLGQSELVAHGIEELAPEHALEVHVPGGLLDIGVYWLEHEVDGPQVVSGAAEVLGDVLYALELRCLLGDERGLQQEGVCCLPVEVGDVPFVDGQLVQDVPVLVVLVSDVLY